MRETTGSTWSLQIMVLFILIFSAFIALVITYSKSYTVKNRIVTVFEKYESDSNDAIEIINSFLINKGYTEKSHCPIDTSGKWYGISDLENFESEEVNDNTNYYYCYSEKKYENGEKYYDIYVFYKFRLPFLGDLLTYNIHGKTKGLINTSK